MIRLDHGKADIENPNGGNTSACFEEKKAHFQPGDFSSDAEFFVFTGVIAWLGASACLVIYVFFSPMYLDDSKKAPMFVSIYNDAFNNVYHKNCSCKLQFSYI